MAKKRRRAAAKQSSDGGESSGDESERGVDELDLEKLRGKLRRQPIEPWQGRDEEIHACEESTRKKMDLKASSAISANGCCQCFTVHMCLAVFGLLTAGLLLTAVGAGTAPRMTPANVFQKYQGVEECVMLRNGDLIPVSKWLGDPKELCDFSREKMEAHMEATKELEPEPEPEPEPSGKEEAGAFECRKNCGQTFLSPQGRGAHERCCTGPIADADGAEIDAARAFLTGLDLTGPQLVDAGDVGGFHGLGSVKSRATDRLLERVHDEVEGLNGARLRAKLRTVDVALATAASDAQQRAAYVQARVKKLVEPVLLARTNFYDESGVFQRKQCQAYVRGLRKGDSKDKTARLRKMIKGLGGKPCATGGAALEAALVDAYEAKTPEVAEASTYNPLAAPKIAAVIAKHGEKLRGRANDDAVLEAVAKTADGLLQQTKGGFMATNGSVIYVHTFWLLRLILDGRTIHERHTSTIFEDFKADDEGKREGYFEADGWRSAVGLKPSERVPYNHSAPFDEARHTLGEIVYGGNGTDGYSIVCFIVEGRKYFVLFCGREDYVLVNEVTLDCLAFVASLALPIVLAEGSSRIGDENYGALSSDALPRLKDILASERDEVYNRWGFRNKWNAMTGFFDGFFADVLSEIAAEGGTITTAPAALSRAADDGVPKQDRSKTEGGFNFDEGQVRNLILRLRGGGGGMCGGKSSSSGNGGRDSDDDDGAGPTGTGSSGGGGAKKKKRPRSGNMGGLMGTDWNPSQWRAGTNG